jgi:hypothetical protein
MAKTKISEFDSNPANNTDIDSINIAEGCAPSGINNAIRELMSQLKDQQTGASSDNFTVGGNLVVTGSTTFTGAVVMSTALPIASGGTGVTSSAAAPFAIKGANSDITSIAGLTTALTVAQGGTGAVTHTSKGALIGNGTSAVTTVSPGTSGNVLTSDGTSWTSAAGAYALTSGTSQASTSGTSIDFTSIPSWVKRITIMFNGVSTNGTSYVIVQLGDAGGVETTSYIGNSQQGGSPVAFSTGFLISTAAAAAAVRYGAVSITLINSNIWVAQGVIADTSNTWTTPLAGSKSLSDTLDRVRITTVNGTDAFDAGSINILYE